MMVRGGGAAWMRVYVHMWMHEKHSLPEECYAKPNYSSLLVTDPEDGVIF